MTVCAPYQVIIMKLKFISVFASFNVIMIVMINRLLIFLDVEITQFCVDNDRIDSFTPVCILYAQLG